MDSGSRAALQHAEHGFNNTTRKKGKTFQHVRKNRKKTALSEKTDGM